jgi:hypothetical protein
MVSRVPSSAKLLPAGGSSARPPSDSLRHSLLQHEPMPASELLQHPALEVAGLASSSYIDHSPYESSATPPIIASCTATTASTSSIGCTGRKTGRPLCRKGRPLFRTGRPLCRTRRKTGRPLCRTPSQPPRSSKTQRTETQGISVLRRAETRAKISRGRTDLLHQLEFPSEFFGPHCLCPSSETSDANHPRSSGMIWPLQLYNTNSEYSSCIYEGFD